MVPLYHNKSPCFKAVVPENLEESDEPFKNVLYSQAKLILHCFFHFTQKGARRRLSSLISLFHFYLNSSFLISHSSFFIALPEALGSAGKRRGSERSR